MGCGELHTVQSNILFVGIHEPLCNASYDSLSSFGAVCRDAGEDRLQSLHYCGQKVWQCRAGKASEASGCGLYRCLCQEPTTIAIQKWTGSNSWTVPFSLCQTRRLNSSSIPTKQPHTSDLHLVHSERRTSIRP